MLYRDIVSECSLLTLACVLYALVHSRIHDNTDIKFKVCDKFYDDFSLINMNFQRLLSYTNTAHTESITPL